MYIGNIPQDLRVSRKKKGAAILLGQIPEVHKALFRCAGGLTDVFRSLEDQLMWTQLLPTTVPGSTTQPY